MCTNFTLLARGNAATRKISLVSYPSIQSVCCRMCSKEGTNVRTKKYVYQVTCYSVSDGIQESDMSAIVSVPWTRSRNMGRQENDRTNERETQGISYNHLTTTHYRKEKKVLCCFFICVSFFRLIGQCESAYELIIEAVHPFLVVVSSSSFSLSFFPLHYNCIKYTVEQHIYGFITNYARHRKFFGTVHGSGPI